MVDINRVISILIIVFYLTGCTTVHYIGKEETHKIEEVTSEKFFSSNYTIMMKDNKVSEADSIYREGDTLHWINNESSDTSASIDEVCSITASRPQVATITGGITGTLLGMLFGIMIIIGDRENSEREPYDSGDDWLKFWIPASVGGFGAAFLAYNAFPDEDVFIINESKESVEKVKLSGN